MLAPETECATANAPVGVRLPGQVPSPLSTPGEGLAVAEAVVTDATQGNETAGAESAWARPYVSTDYESGYTMECTPRSIPVGQFIDRVTGQECARAYEVPSLPRAMLVADTSVGNYSSIRSYTVARSSGHNSPSDAINLWDYAQLVREFIPGVHQPDGVGRWIGSVAIHYTALTPSSDQLPVVFIGDGRTNEDMQAVGGAMAWSVDPTASLTIISHQIVRRQSLAAMSLGDRLSANAAAAARQQDAAQVLTLLEGLEIGACNLMGVGSGAILAAEVAATAAVRAETARDDQKSVHVGHVALLGIPSGRRRSPNQVEDALMMSGLSALQHEAGVVRSYLQFARKGRRSGAGYRIWDAAAAEVLGGPTDAGVVRSLHAVPDADAIADSLTSATRLGGTTVALGAVGARSARGHMNRIHNRYIGTDPGFARTIVRRLAAGNLAHGGKEETLAVNPRVIAAMLRNMMP